MSDMFKDEGQQLKNYRTAMDLRDMRRIQAENDRLKADNDLLRSWPIDARGNAKPPPVTMTSTPKDAKPWQREIVGQWDPERDAAQAATLAGRKLEAQIAKAQDEMSKPRTWVNVTPALPAGKMYPVTPGDMLADMAAQALESEAGFAAMRGAMEARGYRVVPAASPENGRARKNMDSCGRCLESPQPSAVAKAPPASPRGAQVFCQGDWLD